MKYSILIIGLFVISAFSCEKSSIDALSEGDDLVNKDFSESRTLPHHLFQNLSKIYEGEDFVFSPLSIQLALYMAYNGAEGETKDEIRNLLGEQGNTDDVINGRIEDLQTYFNGLLNKGTIDIANAAFYDKNRVTLKDEFSEVLKKHYSASIDDIDFTSSGAIDVINDWALENTNGKISKVIEEISPREILFLLNAIYLKADWDFPFDPDATRTDKFYNSEGSESEVEFMFRDGGYEYLDNEEMAAVKMPLSDTSLYAWFVLPRKEKLNEWSTANSFEKLGSYSEQLKSGRIMLFLPKFKTKIHQNLNSVLNDLGMSRAFDGNSADFSNLGTASSGENIYLSRVIHDAFIQVDEKGVEGAAVTSVGFGATSMPPVIKFDQPFAYFIVDAKNNIPLFAGHFYNNDPDGNNQKSSTAPYRKWASFR